MVSHAFITKGVSRRRQLGLFCTNVAFVSQIEPKSAEDALKDENWFLAMQDQLNHFKRNEVWELVPKSKTQQVIGTKSGFS